jgi:hypothetical protein
MVYRISDDLMKAAMLGRTDTAEGTAAAAPHLGLESP